MKVTLGGDRVGSGKKVKLDLHNYFRSTHDLSQTWTSPMTVGALYPFLVIPAMRNDKFEITLNADTITVPTKGPLFGSFKLQMDVFACPVRLYQAFLHNNPTNIGLKMNQVLFPKYTLSQDVTDNKNHMSTPLNNSCLWKYLGFSGLGKGGIKDGDTYTVERAVNAIPLLAYYDIFKNYYSNKQEDKAYVISKKILTDFVKLTSIDIIPQTFFQTEKPNLTLDPSVYNSTSYEYPLPIYIDLNGKNFDKWDTDDDYAILKVSGSNDDDNQTWTITTGNVLEGLYNGVNTITSNENDIPVQMLATKLSDTKIRLYLNIATAGYIITEFTTEGNTELQEFDTGEDLALTDFDLKNIDDMRMTVLSFHTLGSAYDVSTFAKAPYNVNTYEKSQSPLNGLVVKTYQSDIFNNWVNTDWIDGENGISEITKIATSDGAFKLDQLNLAEKLYNMLNRVAVSGGTYEDWQDAVYDEAPHKHIESPMYLGGMSSEIVFEQIVANTAASTPEGGEQPLGDLAGRGRYIKRKGGNISVKCDEACFIIGIVSITPRIKYTQGNEFYMTEIKCMDDLHKPALDGIGFQNLLGERLAWFDTTQNEDGTLTRSVVGKLPAWIEYMTAVDKTFGDFAEEEGKAFMSLNRNYEKDTNGDIKDVTTYIDPTKYNYAFAYSKLDAQNFWTEIHSKITARRKMSAKQIPNL